MNSCKKKDVIKCEELEMERDITKKFNIQFSNAEHVKKVANFMHDHAEQIEQNSFEHHLAIMDVDERSMQKMKLVQRDHIRGIRYLSECIKDPKHCIKGFQELGVEFSEISLKMDLTIEEAVDGVIFLSEALWDEIEKGGLVQGFTLEDLRIFTYIIGIYHNTLLSSLAFSYHKKHLTESQKEMKEREKLNQQLNMFIHIASHEFRTPIMTMSAVISLLEKHLHETGDEEGMLLIGKARSSCQRLENKADNLFDMSKIESGKLDLKKEDVDLCVLIRKVIEDVQLTVKNNAITLLACPSVFVKSDTDRLDQILTNLLKNAVKFTPPGERVEVWCEDKKEIVRIYVRDFGKGIPKEEQEAVFRPFFQMGENGSSGGLGLGLYISKNIAQALGGDLWVESVRGRGSTFCVSIPVR